MLQKAYVCICSSARFIMSSATNILQWFDRIVADKRRDLMSFGWLRTENQQKTIYHSLIIAVESNYTWTEHVADVFSHSHLHSFL